MNDCDDPYIHLTNNAVQKNATTYGAFEDGNQLSFKDLQRYITEHFPNSKIDVYKDIVEDMKYLVVKSMESVRNKLNPDGRKGCFELLGFDFMIDADFTVWLIECNTNPCIEESSQLLKVLLPRMLDDAFKLTVDKHFPVVSRPTQEASTKELRRESTKMMDNKSSSTSINRLGSIKGTSRKSDGDTCSKHGTPSPYFVDGYNAYQNLWEKLYEFPTGKNYLKVKERRMRCT
jgi:hypothetical protein